MNIQQTAKEYMTKDNLIYSCQYCVMFCPKYRRKVFSEPMQERMKEIFTETADEYDFEILEMDVRPDCVRLIISCDPEFGIVNCVRRLKGKSSKALKEEFPEVNYSDLCLCLEVGASCFTHHCLCGFPHPLTGNKGSALSGSPFCKSYIMSTGV